MRPDFIFYQPWPRPSKAMASGRAEAIVREVEQRARRCILERPGDHGVDRTAPPCVAELP